ncbi:MAG: YbgC/FadM family acyl-CoA thioesterase [Burkholderia sp.]|jgi:acyl-CoA thioester hydrolase
MLNNRFPVRVYWEDTDAGGIVYHANYLRYMERARSDLLRQAGFGQNEERGREGGVIFIVSRIEIDYLKSAELDDDLTVVTRLAKPGRASMVLEQCVMRGEETLTRALVTAVAVDSHTHRPVRIPAELTERLSGPTAA